MVRLVVAEQETNDLLPKLKGARDAGEYFLLLDVVADDQRIALRLLCIVNLAVPDDSPQDGFGVSVHLQTLLLRVGAGACGREFNSLGVIVIEIEGDDVGLEYLLRLLDGGVEHA